MFYMETIACKYWPFLKDALKFMERYPTMTDTKLAGGFIHRDPKSGVTITFRPFPKEWRRLTVSLTREDSFESFSYGDTRENRFYDAPFMGDRRHWPLPWSAGAVMRRMYDQACKSEFGFS